MRLTWCEFIKIASKRWIVATLVLLCGLTVFLSYRISLDSSKDFSVPYSSYAKLMEDISNMPDEEKYAYLQDKAIEYGVYNYIEWGINVDLVETFGEKAYLYVKLHFLNGAEPVYTDYLYSEQLLYEKARDDVGRIVNYPQFLSDIESHAKQMLSVSFFAKPGTFAYRNIQNTPDAYTHLKGTSLSFYPSEGVLLATSSGVIDLFCVLIILILCTVLILQEKEKGLLSLVRPTKNGRGVLLGAKVAAVFLWTAIITALLCISNIVAGAAIYGLGDLSRLIQSVEGFTGSVLKISVLEYLVLFVISKVMSQLVLAAVILLFSVIARNIIFVYGAIIALGGIELALYASISPTSVFSPLKYWNLVSLTQTNGLYREYLNINLLGYPINLAFSSLVVALILLVFFCTASIWIFSKQRNLIWSSGKISAAIGRINPFGRKISVSLIYHEAYKIFITHKALLVLCLLALFQWYSYHDVTAPYDSGDQHYKAYVTQMEGPVTAKTLNAISLESDRYNEIFRRQSELAGQYQSGEIEERAFYAMQQPIQSELASYNAFTRIKQQVQYIKQLIETRDIRGWIVYDTGYKKLFGANGDYSGDLGQGIILALILTICIAPVFASEYTKGTINLISPTLFGRRETMFYRGVLCVLIAITAACAVFLPNLITTLRLYGTSGLSAPLQSIQELSNFPLHLSIGGYLVLLYVIRLLASIAITFAMLGLSVLCRNVVAAMAAGLVIFVLPCAVSLLGGRFMDTWLFNPFLSGNGIRSGVGLTNVIVMIIAAVLLYILGRKRFCKG